MGKPSRFLRIKDPEIRLACAEIVKALGDAGDGFPSGGIIFYLGSACPSGWTEETSLRERFPRGMAPGGTAGTTGGAASADVTGETGMSTHTTSMIEYASGATSIMGVNGYHVHEQGGSVDTIPPYVDGLWCKKS